MKEYQNEVQQDDVVIRTGIKAGDDNGQMGTGSATGSNGQFGTGNAAGNGQLGTGN